MDVMRKSIDHSNTTALKLILVTAVVLIIASRFGADFSRANYEMMEWEYYLAEDISPSRAGIAIGDVNGDGLKETIIGIDSGVRAFSAYGDPIWTRSIGIAPATPMLVDINCDNKLDIILATNTKMSCLSGSDGSIVWEIGVPFVRDSCAAADLDNDGLPEVMAVFSNGTLSLITSCNGTIEWKNNDNVYCGIPIITDLEDDGIIDVLVGSSSGSIVCVSGINGSNSWSMAAGGINGSNSWSMAAGGTAVTVLCIGDVNGDNFADIIANSSTTLYCVSGASHGLLWSSASPGASIDTVLCDVDKNGEMDLIVHGTDLRILAASNGSSIWTYSSGQYCKGMHVADYNGDGTLEIIVCRLNELDSFSGTTHTRMTYSTHAWTLSGTPYSISIVDLNSDGILEAVFFVRGQGKMSYAASVESFRAFTYVGTKFPGQPGPWPCFKSSVLRTNAYLDADNDTLPDSLEQCIGTSPVSNDSDGDGISDGVEIDQGTNPISNQVPPPAFILSNATYTPSNGTTSTTFTFKVTYTHPFNIQPSLLGIYIQGALQPMSKENASDNTYTDGCVYTWSTKFPVGSFPFNFHCVITTTPDFIKRLVTNTYIGPTVFLNTAPALSYGSVAPTNGTGQSAFNYSITYTDAENNAPLYVQVNINGTNHEMIKQNDSDNIYTDGCIYTYGCTLVPGNYIYYFSASDGYAINTTATFTGPLVINNSPTLTTGIVVPARGTPETNFTFAINYIDADNDAPILICLHIADNDYSISKQQPTDMNYIDGCWYSAQLALPLGIYNYWFICSDGYSNVFTNPSQLIISTETVDFTIKPSPSNMNQSVIFTGIATLGFGSVVSWDWDFGDGTPMVSYQNATHVYTRAGTFTITLSIATDYNVTISATHVFRVNMGYGSTSPFNLDGWICITIAGLGLSLAIGVTGTIVATKRRYTRTNARISQLLNPFRKAGKVAAGGIKAQRDETLEYLISEARRRQLSFLPNRELNSMTRYYREATLPSASEMRNAFGELVKQTRSAILAGDLTSAASLAIQLRRFVNLSIVAGTLSEEFKKEATDAIDNLVQATRARLDTYQGELDAPLTKLANGCRDLLRVLDAILPKQSSKKLFDALSSIRKTTLQRY